MLELKKNLLSDSLKKEHIKVAPGGCCCCCTCCCSCCIKVNYVEGNDNTVVIQ